MVAHLCKWLRVSLNHGPSDHPRTQGALKRTGGWLNELMAELCKVCPERWNEYVGAA